jgi:hypothetical protein
MHYRLLTALLVVLEVAYACYSQDEVENILKRDFQQRTSTIEFSLLAFFPKELIKVCTDSLSLEGLERKLVLYTSIHGRYSAADKKESELILNVLYDRLNSVEVLESELKKTKGRLLELFKIYRSLPFKVDTELVATQLDEDKRSMINGYDEGVTAESKFIFLIYNPKLLAHTMKEIGHENMLERLGLSLCNQIRDNSTPKPFRRKMYDEISRSLLELQAHEEFNKIYSDFRQCEISTNLND